ncbi:LacI family DNA-binding transcriptional regulator [Phyllobacterium bourgognense]|uniref:LacI family transcriptional regulator n=1 Tax=Phyllobacterium bourgognense TaxID=314236 RepID=A0A368YJD3_9HYPH|nr:LacI family DNA-binding transcriptional regulator [Phyllobacterium bourgognense]RCW79578.1 LacI family transcriptional regulator [Phyllobacterium bourgognense]
MRRPNMTTLAKEAGVGLSTVDRVLNRRADVREETASRVLEAAERIGFYATPLLRQRLKTDAPQKTFAFLLQQKTTAFYELLGTALREAVESSPAIRGKAIVEFMDDLTPGAVAETLRRVGRGADGVAIVAADHPNVTAAIDELAARHIPVIAMISDLTAPSRAGYVGLDNRKVGRTAGWLLGNMIPAAPSSVAIFVGSHRYLCQEACEIGFRAFLRENAPHLHLLEPVATFESDQYAFEAILDLVKRHEGVKGVYVAGGGIGGVMAAMKELEAHKRPLVVGHDLTEATNVGLFSGTLKAVLSHPIKEIAKETVEILIARTSAARDAPGITHRILPMQIFTPESV